MRRKTVCLALQGGGSHGAFTWGVVDRLLEEPSLEFQAVSGTSAGAMNAAVLVDALKRGGRELARERLEAFWQRVSAAGSGTFKPGRVLGPQVGVNTDWSPWTIFGEAMSLVWSPYDNPFYANVLDDVIAQSIPDFGALNDASPPYLFVCATNVRTNERRIFMHGELSARALTASACLPTLFRAVEIGRDAYWDGGYVGNPSLAPLRSPALVPDIVVVWVNPLHAPHVPKDARAILNRLNEITFNASLVGEIDAIEAVNLLRPASADAPYKRVHLHAISDERYLATLGYASKTNTDWPFLISLRDAGRRAAQRWLETDYETVGARGSADVQAIVRALTAS